MLAVSCIARKPRCALSTALIAHFLLTAPELQRPDWLAGHVGPELKNVDAKYPVERSHRFPVIQPNPPPQRLFAFELRRVKSERS